MMKKILCVFLMIPVLVVGCGKKEDEQKENVIRKDVQMFMDVTEGKQYSELVEMMEKAEKEGLGKFTDNKPEYVGEEGSMVFAFNVVNEEAKKNDDFDNWFFEKKGGYQEMYLDGHAVYEDSDMYSYKGAKVSVEYVWGIGEGSDEVLNVEYDAEDDNEKVGRIVYDFKKGCITYDFGVTYSKKLEKLQNGGSKKEVDEYLVELTN